MVLNRARPSRAAQVSLAAASSPLALANAPKPKRKRRAPKPLAEPKPLYLVPRLPFPICGMDPSLTHTAGHFALIAVDRALCDGGDPTYRRMLSRFSIKTGSDTFSHRLHRLNGMRSAFLFELDKMTRAHGPGLLVVEGYGFASKFGKITERYEWGGQIRMSAYSMGWDVLEVPPTMLKLWTSGYGAAKKDAMMLAVQQRWMYKSLDDNDADAFALSQLGGAFIRWRLGATVTKEEAEQFARLEVWEAKHGRS